MKEVTEVLDNDDNEPMEASGAVVALPAPETPGAQAPLIRIPTRHNANLATILERVNADRELITLWRCANINSVDRMNRSDHGRVHVQIVANIALKLLRLLIDSGVQPSVVRNYNLTNEEAEVIVFLAAVLHDVGIAVHRSEHEHHSLWVAAPKAKELLADLYDIETRTILWSEVMHAIVAHNREVNALTVEAGAVKVADALDMAKGRSRIPFEGGSVNMHSLSAAAIERVSIAKGESRPIRVMVEMGNSAGIFQIDELLKNKLSTSGLREQIEVVATIDSPEERRLVQVFRL